MHTTAFFLNMPLAALSAVVWLALAFAIGRLLHRHAIVDVFWGLGFLFIYAECLLVSDAWSHSDASPWWSSQPHVLLTRMLTLIIVAVWSIRLSGHLALRQRKGGEDLRYVMILRRAKGKNQTWYAIRWIYLLQAGLLWFVSLTLQWIAFMPSANLLVLLVGAVVAVKGLSIEALSDWQLRRFLRDSASQAQTMNRGLWHYSRHPNYFGDALFWWGAFLIAAASGWGLLMVLSPFAMTKLLTSVSGKPLLEAKLKKTRQGYLDYVASTSDFFPWPPKQLPVSNIEPTP